MLQRIVIIAAGGTGSRLNKDLPKQYMLLQDKPVLLHTLNIFVDIADKIIVALHADMFDYWNDLCKTYNIHIKHEIVFGGNTRFQSVQNAVNYIFENYGGLIGEETTIAVHDAARPLTPKELVSQSFKLASQGKSNVLAFQSTNSIRIGSPEESIATDRNKVWQIQTPQTFPAFILQEAYQQAESKLFTDDASVVEKIGKPITLIESNNNNIKLTFQNDFEIANMILNNAKS